METNFLKLYLDANKMLAKTLVIKSQASIDLINEHIKLIYGLSAVDLYDPTTWKYYQNISGEYHTSDIVMTIISLDTLEEIVFSKTNLAIHKETAKAYQYGSRYYYRLLDLYPTQEQLILGILYPADIDIAINAADGTILTYPSYLVEPQELTLINDLQDFITGYLVRWNVQAFGLSDNLYNTAQHALLYLSILPRLLNLRLKRCHTNEVHSFHIREYLASHGKLDNYLPYLTLKQALYLYRNIRYIEHHSGQVEQFDELVDHLLTDRRIPLNEFSVRQLSEFDALYYNTLSIRRKAINPQFNVPEKTYFDYDLLAPKEESLVYGNLEYLNQYNDTIIHQLQTSNSSVLQSKDLESSMVDYSNSVPDTLESILLHQWGCLSTKGFYTAVINFKDPKTLEERQLSASDAFIYMLYISAKMIGIDVQTLPSIINIKQRRLVLPTKEELLAVVEDRYNLTSVAERLLDQQPQIQLIQSVSSFFDISYLIYNEALYHWYLLSNTHHRDIRGYIQGMVHLLYEIEYLELSSEQQLMSEWLFTHNLPEYSLDTAQAKELATNIFKAATGLNSDDTRLLKNIQQALINILKQLSSYSIQFITEINTLPIIPIGWAAIRVGRSYGDLRHNNYSEANVRVIDTYAGYQQLTSIETDVNNVINKTIQSLHSDIFVSIGIVDNQVTRIQQGYEFYFNAYQLSVDSSPDITTLGLETYNDLTLNQKQTLLSIYH